MHTWISFLLDKLYGCTGYVYTFRRFQRTLKSLQPNHKIASGMFIHFLGIKCKSISAFYSYGRDTTLYFDARNIEEFLPQLAPARTTYPQRSAVKLLITPQVLPDGKSRADGKERHLKNLTKLPSSRDLCTNLSANSILGTYRCRRQKDIFFSALLKNAAQRALACSRLICRTPLPSGAAVNLHRDGVRRSLHKAKQASCKILL